MVDFLTFPFLQEALLIGIIISLSAGLLSPYLVLNEQGMIAHGLSHISFTGFVLGLLLFEQPLWIAIPFAVVSSIIIQWLSTRIKLQGDVSIGIVSSIAFAIGLILVKTSPKFNVSIESLLVGNIFTLRPFDILFNLVILILIFVFVVLNYNQLFMMTYDQHYARFLKIKVSLLRYILAILTAIFIVLGVRSIGVLLITSLVIFPAAVASRWTNTFKMTVIFSSVIAIMAAFLGIVMAHPLNIPASAMIVMIYTVMFIFSFIPKMKGASK